MLDNLNIVLLALTKVNADGQWITSMFNYADDKGVATVALSSGKGWDPYPVEFAKLDKLKAHMPLDDHAWEITVVDPWYVISLFLYCPELMSQVALGYRRRSITDVKRGSGFY
jgi:hypothetical protein